MASDPQLQAAYRHCRRLAHSHYENFPVASLLLPRPLRNPVAAIYAFARQADDIADEGHAAPAERIHQLDFFQQQLSAIKSNQVVHNAPVWLALQDTVERFQLPVMLFEDLLRAFRQDVTQTRYADMPALLDYCHYSANPVGRLVLSLAGPPTEAQRNQSDCICTALQLINFFQDIEQDYLEKNRIYLPQDQLSAAGIDEKSLLAAPPVKLAQVLRPLYQYTRGLMLQGLPLGSALKGRLGWEIRAMILGGIQTLTMLMQLPDEQLLSRPRLSRRQTIAVLLQARNHKRFYRYGHFLLRSV